MDRDPRLNADTEQPERAATAADRRRALVIALFVIGSLAAAVVLAFFYALPSAD